MKFKRMLTPLSVSLITLNEVEEGPMTKTKVSFKTKLTTLLASIFIASGSLSAQDVEEEPAMEEVVVLGERQFLQADTSGVTNLPIPIEQLPQSVSLMTQDFINTADIRTLSDVAEHTPGAIQTGSPLGLANTAKLRGFGVGQLVDGLNIAALYDVNYSTYKRVEAIRGPSSVVYGVSSAGGLFNFVTKSGPNSVQGHSRLRVGSWSNFLVEGEFGGPLTDSGNVRALGLVSYGEGDSFIHSMDHKTGTVYGAFDFDIGEKVTAYIHGGYEYRDRVSFDGMPTLPNGDPAPVSRSFFIGSPDARLESDIYHVNAGISWQASDVLEFEIKANYNESTTEGLTPYASGLQETGDFQLNAQQLDPFITDNFGLGVSGQLALDGIGLEDSFISASYLSSSQNQDATIGFYNFDFSFSIPANIFDGEAEITRLWESGMNSGDLGQFLFDDDYQTLSIQSVLKPMEALSVLLGVSRSSADSQTSISIFGGPPDVQVFDFDPNTSYRAALVYEFPSGFNAYFSFSESFQPQLFRDVGGVTLPPLVGEQYEAGVKWISDDGRLLLTGALFEIAQANEAQFDQVVDGQDRFRAVGEVKHKGFELEAIGQIKDYWQINASFSSLNAKVTDDTNSDIVGSRRPFLPKYTASLFTSYSLSSSWDGFEIGGGYRYVSSQPTSLDGSTTKLPSYFLVDVYASYRFDSWSVQLNARNIFNEHYWTNTYDTLFFGNLPGEPASVALTLRKDFQ